MKTAHTYNTSTILLNVQKIVNTIIRESSLPGIVISNFNSGRKEYSEISRRTTNNVFGKKQRACTTLELYEITP